MEGNDPSKAGFSGDRVSPVLSQFGNLLSESFAQFARNCFAPRISASGGPNEPGSEEVGGSPLVRSPYARSEHD